MSNPLQGLLHRLARPRAGAGWDGPTHDEMRHLHERRKAEELRRQRDLALTVRRTG